VGQPFEVTKYDWLAVLLGQPANLFVQYVELLGLIQRTGGRVAGGIVHQRVRPRRSPQAAGRPVGDAIQPGRQAAGPTDRMPLADQNEKIRLERVVDVIRIREDLAANRQYQRTVKLDDRLQGASISALKEAGKQILLGHPTQAA
jgi:hypothetical protein